MWLTLYPVVGSARSGDPPPPSFEYIQYGVGFVAETVASAGDVCPNVGEAPCILGSGFGPSGRLGYRTRGSWYFGGAYEFSRQDSSSLLRLAILQQLRAESRYYLDHGDRVTPYGEGSLGTVAFGNEWGVDTGGVVASVGPGIEFELSGGSVIGASLVYRLLVLRHWRDRTGQERADRHLGVGYAHMVGLALNWEIREALPRW